MVKMLHVKSMFKIVGGCILAISMSGALTACSTYDSTTVGAGYSSRYSYPYDYYYYPYSRVYFSISTGYYYYPDGNSWVKVSVLPSRFYLDTRGRVTVRLKSNDRPYIYHNTHRQRYIVPPTYRVDRNRDRIERKSNRDRKKRFFPRR